MSIIHNVGEPSQPTKTWTEAPVPERSPYTLAEAQWIVDNGRCQSMMRLYTFNEQRFAKLARSTVTDVAACLLYYLFNGRNAWHSTWVTQYSDGCMHPDLPSAKDGAERQRTQGSVFYIKELPAILFSSVDGFLAVTEINTPRPLGGYSLVAVRAQPESGFKKMDGAVDCYLKPSVPILGAALSFDFLSRFWNQRPLLKNAVAVVATEDPAIAFQPLPDRRLETWRSHSMGSVRTLGWARTVDRRTQVDVGPITKMIMNDGLPGDSVAV